MKKSTKITIIIAIFLITVISFGILGFALADYISNKRIEDCSHEHWTNGICDNCKVHCGHDYWKNGTCCICNISHEHNWDNKTGTCNICHITCNHKWEKGLCSVCGFKCINHIFKDGICTICNYQCPHEHWNNGICSDCKYHCKHEYHDPETQICADCKEKVPHHFINGQCLCGATPLIYNTMLPKEYLQPCDEQGSVQTKDYETAYYGAGEPTPIYKKVNIYLPYNYNEDSRYNVIFLVHGAGGNEGDWTTNQFDTPNGSATMCNIFDNMIKDKICQPFIAVAISTYTDFMGEWIDTGIAQISVELREILVPYIASHYSTYAESGSIDNIIKAREHFGIGGLSNGSLYAYNAGLQVNFDLFGNYMCLSGNNQAPQVVEKLNSDNWIDLPMHFLYVGAGTYDSQKERSCDGYHYILDRIERISDSKNAMYVEIEGGHEWQVWSTSFFNAIQLMF